ncbi:methyltransferase family protein [Candidatus Harpocratesius sp.]
MIFLLKEIKDELFIIDLIFLYILFVGIIWSVAVPNKRIWPPPKRKSLQYLITWILFTAVFIINALFIFIDWNNWIITSSFRFFIAIPLIILGSMLFLWGITTLGIINTSGIKNGFIILGAYRFTRNPQYLGDIILFMGLSILANSLYLLITNILLSLVFIITPWAEEIWLEEQYGDEYIKYKKITPRFF